MSNPTKVFLGVLLFAITAVRPASGQTAYDLFDDSTLQEIRLTMVPSDWQTLKDRYLEDDYYRASLSWRGIVVEEIGVRSRGTASRSGVKPYLGLDFKRYKSNQRFLGLSSLRLKNALQDASLMHERLSMLLFRRMNLAAPREGYARLYMNEEFIGLYVIIEEIDTTFLQRAFGGGNGFLLEYIRLDDYHMEYLGDDPALYVPSRFEPKTRKTEFNASTIVELIAAINSSSDEDFAANVSLYLDLQNFLRYIAVENYLAEWDGFLGHMGMNNYYLYQPEDSTAMSFIAWDKEQGFGDPTHSIRYQADLNVLMRRCLANPKLHAVYLDALRRTALESGGADGWLLAQTESFYEQIRLAALEDNRKLSSNADFEAGVDAIRIYIPARFGFLITEVGTQLPPRITGGIVNGASLMRQPAVAGSIATILGAELAFTSRAAANDTPSLRMSTTEVSVNGMTTPLLFVSPGRIDFQVPWELAGFDEATLTVSVNGLETEPQPLPLALASPGLFSYYHDGRGQGAIWNAMTGQPAAPGGSISGVSTNSVQSGDTIALFATGLGAVTNTPPTGEISSSGTISLTTMLPVVTIGGVPAQVVFSGLSPQWAGVYQINTVVPDAAPSGDSVPVTIGMENSLSNEVTMAIR